MDARQRLLNDWQHGFPLCARPYAQLAQATGEAAWISCRDDNRVQVIDTRNFETLASIDAPSPSGVFFTARAARIGF